MTPKKWTSLLFCLAVTLALAAPVFAWGTPNDSEKPGSVLVFPKFITGTFNDSTGQSGQPVHAVTELEISVVCPTGQTCPKNPITGTFEKVFLRGHWVCPDCIESSFDLVTTINGSLYFNPEGVTALVDDGLMADVITANAFPSNATTTIALPPCPRGYLIVWVTDGSGTPIKFDGLIGDAVIREGSKFCAATFPCLARAYNAIPIQARPDLAPGFSTDDIANGGNGDGNLDFDGNEYQMITGKIFGTVRYENVTAKDVRALRTDLTLLTLDVASNVVNPVTTAKLNFYKPDEDFVDTATSFRCWTEKRLTEINLGLTVQNMGRKGLVESTSATQQLDFFTTKDVTLLGIVETVEFDLVGDKSRDYSYSLYNDGEPVATTFKP